MREEPLGLRVVVDIRCVFINCSAAVDITGNTVVEPEAFITCLLFFEQALNIRGMLNANRNFFIFIFLN